MSAGVTVEGHDRWQLQQTSGVCVRPDEADMGQQAALSWQSEVPCVKADWMRRSENLLQSEMLSAHHHKGLRLSVQSYVMIS